MPPSPNSSRKVPKFLDVKLFIAALALAVTIGLWNLLSTGSMPVTKANPDPVAAPPPQTDTQDGQGFGAIPTLVPLVEVDFSALSAVQNVSSVSSAPTTNQPATTLRSVTAPTTDIVQKTKPRVATQSQVVVVSGGGGGGGSRSGGGAPVATTSSSK